MYLLPALKKGWSSITHDQQFASLTSSSFFCLSVSHP
jgi:hypothetical protein